MMQTAALLFFLQDERGIWVEMHARRGLIGWIIIGLLAGWLAGKLSRGRGFGCIVDVILGLIGAVIGGWIFSKLGIVTFGFLGSLAAATLGAVLLVTIARLFAGGALENFFNALGANKRNTVAAIAHTVGLLQQRQRLRIGDFGVLG